MANVDFPTAYNQWLSGLDSVRRLDKLFIIGCGRSGTTWLMNALNGHDEIVVCGEGRFFHRLEPFLIEAFAGFNKSQPNPDNTHAATLLRETDVWLILRTMIDSQFARYISVNRPKPGLKIVGDKTPIHTLAMAKIMGMYPEAKFIHIIRDPRDMATSQWVRFARNNDSRGVEAYTEEQITRTWVTHVEAARRGGVQLGNARYAEVRYEDLMENEQAEVSRLLRFLGVDASAEQISKCVEAGSFKKHTGGRKRGEEVAGAFYRKGVVGDWVNHLPADVVLRSCRKIAPLMRSCGYDPEAMPDDVGSKTGSLLEPSPV
jgi:LPS sulfotransferase NodH